MHELTVKDLINILEKQAQILVERAKEHGAFDSFTRAGEYSGHSPAEVAHMLCGVKRARLESNPFNEDSLIDLLNYQAIETIFRVNEMRREYGQKIATKAK
jgi:hypothetical protein